MNNAADPELIKELTLLASRNDILKASNEDLKRANNKLRKAFIDLLEHYQLELDRRNSTHDREQIDYHWLDKAGVLD
jgi:hypothetical protein